MSKSLLYAVNDTPQDVAAGGTAALGSVVRRFGCNAVLSGNGVILRGQGYYNIDCIIVAEAAAAEEITATLYRDGVAIPGATASATADADSSVTLPIIGVVREQCCDSSSTITCRISAGATLTNVALRVVKE